jgi:hypothetical protein
MDAEETDELCDGDRVRRRRLAAELHLDRGAIPRPMVAVTQVRDGYLPQVAVPIEEGKPQRGPCHGPGPELREYLRRRWRDPARLVEAVLERQTAESETGSDLAAEGDASGIGVSVHQSLSFCDRPTATVAATV